MTASGNKFTVRRFAKLAAFGAIAVSLGLAALYAFIAYISRHTPTGGMEATQVWITWISVAVPVAAIIAAHLVYAKVLFDESRRA